MSSPDEMRAFVQVVERQSFGSASTVLGLTPSAVSKLVTRLEDRLGVRLLHRTTRRLALTPEGDIYFARARQILADIEEAEAQVAKLRAAPRGHLRINTSIGFGIHQLAPAMPDFLTRYPEIDVELALTDRVVDLVSEHADMTIRAGPVAETALTARKLADVTRLLCASPAYLTRYGVPRTPADLARHSCIVMAFQTPYRWAFRNHGKIEEIEIKPRVVTDNAEAALRLALNGAGIVRLSDMVVGESIRGGLLVPLLTEAHHVEAVPLSALYLAGRHRLPKVRVFLDFLVERFSSATLQVAVAPGRSNASSVV
ncbi:LysR family transcriptional regulator [Bradyrhizobium frederickii]|uniref:LysR family transcriptional regulator n=1 Tax=Bradyrhizobium frederickii TaxID=2560054 RepID=A0A4Y9L404_9BRAD|nr:LysR family transcriptional regulator [Bradyrhizobium frederickii]TFV38311.1 LysR family transcriptional regulator [Bradyrhizobium frederickii]